MNGGHYVVGIDVGGTNTDAILLQNEAIVARCKTPTTEDRTTGIVIALKELFASNQNIVNQISSINIGTTTLLNAFLERRNLDKPLIVRLGKPFANAHPPTIGWDDEAKALVGNCHQIRGGYQYNQKGIQPLDVPKIEKLAEQTVTDGIESVAITGIFSPINPDQEILAGRIFRKVNPKLGISLSHQLGDLGLLGRENAAIVNAMLFRLYHDVCESIKRAMQNLGINTKVYLTQGNGIKSRIDSIYANPLLTLRSGPLNSIKGAARIADVQHAVVVDIGGTSTDVGIIKSGQPVNENCQTNDQGIHYTFTTPRINNFRLGGGTEIKVNDEGKIEFCASVGFDLLKKALAFGGEILTPTDIALASDRLAIPNGDPDQVRQALLKKEYHRESIRRFYEKNEKIIIEELTVSHVKNFIEKVDDAIYERLRREILATIDSMEEIPENLILVGGGAKLFDLERLRLDFIQQQRKFRKVFIPDNADVANALGAGISLLGCTVKKYYDNDEAKDDIQALTEKTLELAKELLIKQGADPATIVKSSVHSLTLSYLQKPLILLSLSAVGKDTGDSVPLSESDDINDVYSPQASTETLREKFREIEELPGKRPTIDEERTTLLSIEAINDMALGAGWLGSGGGADPEKARLVTVEALKEKDVRLRLVSLDDLPDDALVVSFGGMGSPNIGYEKLFTKHEGINAVRRIEWILHEKGEKKCKVDALLATEGAGANGLYPLFLAAKLGIPVVDADCKGRALPFLNQITPSIFGKFDNILAVLSNGISEEVIHATSFDDLEKTGRALNEKMAGSVSKAQLPLTGKQVKELTIKETLSTVRKIGEAVRLSSGLDFSDRLKALNKVLAATDYKEAKVICEGKIEVFVPTKDGALRVGGFVIKDAKQNELFGIGFQNENLFVRKYSDSDENENIALMPEIINVVDKTTFQIISCEKLKFGQEVVIVVMSPPEMLTRPEAKEVIRTEDILDRDGLIIKSASFPLKQLYALIDGLFLKIKRA